MDTICKSTEGITKDKPNQLMMLFIFQTRTSDCFYLVSNYNDTGQAEHKWVKRDYISIVINGYCQIGMLLLIF